MAIRGRKGIAYVCERGTTDVEAYLCIYSYHEATATADAPPMHNMRRRVKENNSSASTSFFLLFSSLLGPVIVSFFFASRILSCKEHAQGKEFIFSS